MNEEIKQVLMRIEIRRMELKSKLELLSYLLNTTTAITNNDIDAVLDELRRLDEIEKDIRSKIK